MDGGVSCQRAEVIDFQVPPTFHPSQAVSDLFLAEANGDIDATLLIM
jgi:hypothetical protein